MKALSFYAFISIFAALLSADTALADTASSAAVKVLSSRCKESADTFAGSGYAFQHLGRVYVVTSEHVVLHFNGPFCHRVQLAEKAPISAKLLIADWSIGLALLDAGAAPTKSVLPRLASIQSSLPSPGKSVRVLGYPHASVKPIDDSRGRILVAQSERHFIPALRSLMEILDSHGEFGMSGGPVLDPSNGELLGLLSHQVVQMVPGGKSRVVEYNRDSQRIENHLLAIPAPEILRWLERYFNDRQLKPAAVRDADAQWDGIDAVISAGLRFEAETSGSESPIGGGDGHGIGGKHPSMSAQKIRVSFAAASAPATSSALFAGREDWLESLRMQLYQRVHIAIPYFVEKNSSLQELRRIPFLSLADFFQKLSDPRLAPVTLLSRPRSATQFAVELRRKGEWLTERAESLQTRVSSADAKRLLRAVSLAGQLIRSENWDLLDDAGMARLTDTERDREGWAELFEVDFNAIVELLKTLEESRVLLRKLRL